MLNLLNFYKGKTLMSALVQWKHCKGCDLYHYTIYRDGREKIEVRFAGKTKFESIDLNCLQIDTLYVFLMNTIRVSRKIG